MSWVVHLYVCAAVIAADARKQILNGTFDHGRNPSNFSKLPRPEKLAKQDQMTAASMLVDVCLENWPDGRKNQTKNLALASDVLVTRSVTVKKKMMKTMLTTQSSHLRMANVNWEECPGLAELENRRIDDRPPGKSCTDAQVIAAEVRDGHGQVAPGGRHLFGFCSLSDSRHSTYLVFLLPVSRSQHPSTSCG